MRSTFARVPVLLTLALSLMVAIGPLPVSAESLPIVADVEFQPLSAQVRRVVEALEMLGQGGSASLCLLLTRSGWRRPSTATTPRPRSGRFRRCWTPTA